MVVPVNPVAAFVPLSLLARNAREQSSYLKRMGFKNVPVPVVPSSTSVNISPAARLLLEADTAARQSYDFDM